MREMFSAIGRIYELFRDLGGGLRKMRTGETWSRSVECAEFPTARARRTEYKTEHAAMKFPSTVALLIFRTRGWQFKNSSDLRI